MKYSTKAHRDKTTIVPWWKKAFTMLMIGSTVSSLPAIAQNTFSLYDKASSAASAVRLSDSLELPVLLFENRAYVLGADCISTMLLGGDYNDRDRRGGRNDRYADGDANDRSAKGSSINRKRKKRLSNDRRRRGRANERRKRGGANDRSSGGQANERELSGLANNRSASLKLAEGTRCELSKNKKKLLIYTREKISAKKAVIYYQGKTFNSKYFTIKKA